MEITLSKWIGEWESFENYIHSTDEQMLTIWQQAEALTKTMPMFARGVKAFWESACFTNTKENPIPVSYWYITQPSKDALQITWTLQDQTQHTYTYSFHSILEKGLENKPSTILCSDEPSPFQYVLLMEPMPEKTDNGLLPHLHFQYAKESSVLVKDNSLLNPLWYATMVDSTGTQDQKYDLLRALHKLK